MLSMNNRSLLRSFMISSRVMRNNNQTMVMFSTASQPLYQSDKKTKNNMSSKVEDMNDSFKPADQETRGGPASPSEAAKAWDARKAGKGTTPEKKSDQEYIHGMPAGMQDKLRDMKEDEKMSSSNQKSFKSTNDNTQQKKGL